VSGDQVLQIVGALLILAGFILSQMKRLDASSYQYLILNLVGAAILAVLAFQAGRWGFVLLEGVWALVALGGLILRLAGKEPAATPARPQP
jgi:membrane-bound ClpP family serine protease